jgi:hypothetical protein
MTLSDLAAVGGFISGIAVLVSLIYLSVQVKQAEQNQKAMMQQARTDRSIDLNMAIVRDPIIVELVLKARDPSKTFNFEDISRYVAFQRAIFLNGENTYYQHRHGMMHEDAYKTWENTIRFNLSSPVARVSWIETRSVFGPDYAKFIDTLIEETPVLNRNAGDETEHRWKANLQKEMARAAT